MTIALLFMLFLLVACGGVTAEEQASLAAKGYYTHLIKGEYELFLEGKQGAGLLPENYRSQLLDGYRQYVAQQETLHHGIREVRVATARRDTLANYTEVFLILCFGDSTNEEVVVPMEEHQGQWRMR